MLRRFVHQPKILRNEKDKHRTHPFSRTIPNMIQCLSEHAVFPRKRLVKKLDEFFKFSSYGLLDK